ncbi:hypothetical protein R5R35_007279 [Gryllus longicercus]|uniref:Uncharacterized protein n=1 Tax=Gryllus longicercus TaxID=2509291 RepID=A0AAN9W2M1_9ORTH
MDIEFLKKKKKTKPKRGYYSEVIGTSDHPVELQEEFGAPKRRNLTSELETERYAPLLPYWIGPPDRKTFLAPAQRWITFDESEIAFPIDAFKPKVQREVVTQPRTLPRNVLIERRRREYCTADIGAMLEAAGVDKKDLVPTVLMDRVLKRQEKFQLNQNIPFLPLELFDNDDYEIRQVIM